MSKRKHISLIIFTIFVSFIMISTVKAAKTSGLTIVETKTWKNALGLNNIQYNTKKGNGSLTRKTENIGGFKINSSGTDCGSTNPTGSNTGGCENARWFCVEPGTPLENNSRVTKAYITDTAPTVSNGWSWDVAGDATHLKKVLSCWYNNNYSVIATQAIVWEIITEERSTILTNKILNDKNYKPYLKDGSSTFGSKSGITSLYEIFSNSGSGSEKISNSTKRKNLYKAYKEVLECAARFNKMPSKAYDSDTSSANNPIKLTNYDAKSQKFSTTISDSLLNYYTIESKDGLSVTLNNGKLTVSTGDLKGATKTVKLRYTYITKNGVDGKSHKLRDDGELKYLVSDNKTSSGKKPQAMARGSMSKVINISFTTAAAPKYQIKLTKKDDAGNVMSGVKFYVCAASNIKSGQSCNNSNKITTVTTDNSGVATYNAINTIGSYVAQEVVAPSGYAIDSQPATFNVVAANVAGTNSFAIASKTFVNKKMHLKMLKRTLDTNGKVIDLPSDTCPKSICPDGSKNGPIFTIKSGGKQLCVTKLSDGKYRYKSLSDTCTDAEKYIETCNGAFDIELIPAGTYEVTEEAAPCDMTLPSNNKQTVVVKPNTPVTTVTMLNGVTGVVFTKVTENGAKLDGGKFALQRKNNGIYEDMLLVHTAGAIYEYKRDATSETENATYLLDTTEGIINVKGLPKGEYRMVEKQAPKGYDPIKEKDSTATVTISDAAKATDYYQIKLVNQKTQVEGNSDEAEFVVTIKTGRNVINYPIVIGIVVVVLVAAIIIRKKIKK